MKMAERAARDGRAPKAGDELKSACWRGGRREDLDHKSTEQEQVLSWIATISKTDRIDPPPLVSKKKCGEN